MGVAPRCRSIGGPPWAFPARPPPSRCGGRCQGACATRPSRTGGCDLESCGLVITRCTMLAEFIDLSSLAECGVARRLLHGKSITFHLSPAAPRSPCTVEFRSGLFVQLHALSARIRDHNVLTCG